VKRTVAVLAALALSLSFAACGGDDDDDEGGAASSPTTAEASTDDGGDFCELWPALNDDQTDLSAEKPTEEQIAEARRLLAEARDAAPEEIGKEVDQLGEALEGVLDDLESGKDLDPEAMFGELFSLAFSAGPPIEEWLVDNCPDYDPQSGFEDDGTGVLGIPDADGEPLVVNAAITPGDAGTCEAA
jgi:hypothetical protein